MDLELFEDLDDYTKKIYIDAGYNNIDKILNASLEELSKIGSKQKYKFFRNLQRFVHSKNLIFKFERSLDYKNKLIIEGIDIRLVDMSDCLIRSLEDNKIKNTKYLNEILINNPYNLYKMCRNQIKADLGYSNCLFFSKLLNFDINAFSLYEQKYQDEKNFYSFFKEEYEYIKNFFNNINIDINRLSLNRETKFVLSMKGINTFKYLLYEYYNSFINKIEIYEDSFSYNVYDKCYFDKGDINKLFRIFLLELKNNSNYISFKENIESDKRNINGILISELNLRENIIYRLGNSKIFTIGDLLLKSKKDILNMFNFDNGMYDEIIIELTKKLLCVKNKEYNELYFDKIFELLNEYFESAHSRGNNYYINDILLVLEKNKSVN